MARQLSQSYDVAAKAELLLQTHASLALARVNERPQQAREKVARLTTNPKLLSGGEQEIIARSKWDKAVETLAALLAERKDGERLPSLLERVRRVPRAVERWPAGSRRGSRPTPGSTRMTIAEPHVALAKNAAGGP